MRYMSALNGPSLSLLATLLWVCDLQQIIFHTMASQLCGKERWFNFAISNWAREKSEVNGTGRLSAMMIRTHGVWSSAWKRSGREDRNWARKWVGYRSSTDDEKKSGWQKKKGLLLFPPFDIIELSGTIAVLHLEADGSFMMCGSDRVIRQLTTVQGSPYCHSQKRNQIVARL